MDADIPGNILGRMDEKMKKVFGAIDIGTNSTRLFIGKVQGSEILPLKFCLQTTRIGQGVSASGYLLPEAIQRTIRVLQEYRGNWSEWV